MKTHFNGFHSPFSGLIERYVAFKRALNRGFRSEEYALRLFDAYVVAKGVTSADEVTAQFIESFLDSRHRTRPRSHNHLLGVLRQWFNWIVQQGELSTSPTFPHGRRTTSERVNAGREATSCHDAITTALRCKVELALPLAVSDLPFKRLDHNFAQNILTTNFHSKNGCNFAFMTSELATFLSDLDKRLNSLRKYFFHALKNVSLQLYPRNCFNIAFHYASDIDAQSHPK